MKRYSVTTYNRLVEQTRESVRQSKLYGYSLLVLLWLLVIAFMHLIATFFGLGELHKVFDFFYFSGCIAIMFIWVRFGGSIKSGFAVTLKNTQNSILKPEYTNAPLSHKALFLRAAIHLAYLMDLYKRRNQPEDTWPRKPYYLTNLPDNRYIQPPADFSLDGLYRNGFKRLVPSKEYKDREVIKKYQNLTTQEKMCLRHTLERVLYVFNLVDHRIFNNGAFEEYNNRQAILESIDSILKPDVEPAIMMKNAFTLQDFVCLYNSMDEAMASFYFGLYWCVSEIPLEHMNKDTVAIQLHNDFIYTLLHSFENSDFDS